MSGTFWNKSSSPSLLANIPTYSSNRCREKLILEYEVDETQGTLQARTLCDQHRGEAAAPSRSAMFNVQSVTEESVMQKPGKAEMARPVSILILPQPSLMASDRSQEKPCLIKYIKYLTRPLWSTAIKSTRVRRSNIIPPRPSKLIITVHRSNRTYYCTVATEQLRIHRTSTV